MKVQANEQAKKDTVNTFYDELAAAPRKLPVSKSGMTNASYGPLAASLSDAGLS